MTKFHAVLLDETGCEFGVSVEAESHAAAWEMLGEDYPESRCVQLESPQDTAEREARMMDEIRRENGDYDYDYEDEDEDEGGDDGDPEDGGQPDEAQEWHDFDPDC